MSVSTPRAQRKDVSPGMEVAATPTLHPTAEQVVQELLGLNVEIETLAERVCKTWDRLRPLPIHQDIHDQIGYGGAPAKDEKCGIAGSLWHAAGRIIDVIGRLHHNGVVYPESFEPQDVDAPSTADTPPSTPDADATGADALTTDAATGGSDATVDGIEKVSGLLPDQRRIGPGRRPERAPPILHVSH